MKKSLLSLLAVAVAAVGCQNYDDRFDDLNSQIAALSSQVAGLAQVQSDLQSLAGTVSSLQSTVASTATAIEGLDGLAETVAEISDAVDNVASSEEVADIAEDLDTAQEDLQELLDASSVFTSNVVVNSVATLDVYHKMGSSLNVVAGNVDITAKPDMDSTKLQELVDNIFTTTGHFTYEASQSSVAPVTFNNLTGTQTLTIDQAGDYIFQTLGSATVINLKDSYKSKVTKIDFRELTSVQKFQTDGTDNTISFSKAVELHLTKLVYYPPLSLTVVTDEGAAMPFVLDDIDASGDQSDLTLDIEGPASFNVSNIEDGSMTFKDVATVTVNGFEGAFTIKGGVESFSADEVVTLTLSNTIDLETLDITGAKDADVTTSVGPALNLASLSSLETVDVDGFFSSVDATSNGNLASITIAADVAGAIDIDGNSDLTDLIVTGAKATSLTVNNNADIEALTVDLTFRAGTATGAKLDGELVVTDNSSLESLTSSSDNIETLKVTGNDDLTTIDFTGLTKAGATNTASVEIYDNDIEGVLIDKDDTASSKTDAGEANDLGQVSTDNGMKTLKAYFTAADATADKILVLFDTVDFTNESDATSETLWDATKTAANQSSNLKVMDITSGTPGDAATAAKRSFLLEVGDALFLYANNTAIHPNSSTVNISANLNTAVNDILTTAALAAADAAGVTMTAQAFASPVAYFNIGVNSSAAENSATAASGSFSFQASDTFTFSVDGQAVKLSKESANIHATVTFANKVMDLWNATYASPTTKSRWVLASRNGTASDPLGLNSVVIEASASDKGSREINAPMSASISAQTKASTSIGVVIGNDQNFTKSTGDNIAQGSDVLLTLTADTAGNLLGEIGEYNDPLSDAANAVSITANTLELSSSRRPNGASASSAAETKTNVYPTESRLDVVLPEEANAAVAAASTFSRLGWL